ncbi:MAG: sigma 54-interacting transcriptional regulator [bacterium]
MAPMSRSPETACFRFDLKNERQPYIRNLSASPVIMQELIDEIPVGMFITDRTRRIMLINRTMEALTGFSRETVRGIPCCHVLRCSLCIKDCPVVNMDRDSEAVSRESDIINRDRQLIPVRVTSAVLKDQKNNLVGFLETVEDLRALRELNARMNQAFSFSRLIGRSPKMEKIYQILPILAQSDSSVLITGETGTGKDLVAEAIHQSSNRAKGPFVKINCGALPANLLESELFGHQKGAFTGATDNKPGRFRLAHNGTLFLTEIGDLPLALQVKLLTFLDDQVIFPLGSTRGFQANVRVVGGTHRNLERMVREGNFREDLLFRLNVVRIHLPPLREREGDFRLLADHFFRDLLSRFQKRIKGFSPKTLQILKSYPFPGNVRELRNIVEYAVNVCQSDMIELEHLPAYLFDSPAEMEAADTAPPERPAVLERQGRLERNGDAGETWSQVERELIMDAMRKAGGRRNEAAEILGWGRSTLWRKMKKLNLN